MHRYVLSKGHKFLVLFNHSNQIKSNQNSGIRIFHFDIYDIYRILFYQAILQLLPNIIFSPMDPPSIVMNNKIEEPAHKADVARLQILRGKHIA